MKRSLILITLGLIGSAAQAADGKNCGEIVLVKRGTCAEIQAVLNQSACGGEASLPAKLAKCTPISAQFTAKSGTQQFEAKFRFAENKDWGGGDWVAVGKTKFNRKPAQLYTDEHRLTHEIADAEPTPPPAPAIPSPSPSPGQAAVSPNFNSAVPITIYGDFRYRHEIVVDETKAITSTQQDRIRARFGLRAQVADDTLLDFRLATGPGRTDTNQTLFNAGANAGILLDRAYFKWSALETTNLYGGRIPNLHFISGNTDFIFDTDLNFDGLHLLNEFKNPLGSVFFNTGFFWLQKKGNGGALTDQYLTSAQVGSKFKFDEKNKLIASVAFYDFVAVQGNAALDAGAKVGNTITSSKYAYGYRVLNPALEFTTTALPQPVVVYGEFAHNTAVSSEGSGFQVGTKVGKLSKQGDVMVTYDYRLVQKDMTASAFTDGDSYGGGTNGKCHRISLAYKVRNSWHVASSFYLGSRNIADGQTSSPERKVQLDLMFAF